MHLDLGDFELEVSNKLDDDGDLEVETIDVNTGRGDTGYLSKEQIKALISHLENILSDENS